MKITLVLGDITAQQVDAIVNAANPALRPGGGVDGAIHARGGPEIEAECRARYPQGLPTGQAVPTAAGRLTARWVIHAVGPVYVLGEDRSPLLASCYREALRVADDLGAATVAFPAISTGTYGWPLADAARIAMDTLRMTSTKVTEARIVLFMPEAYQIFESELERQRLTVGARLDVNVVPLDTEDEVTVLVEIAAPAELTDRAPASLQVVLDRSGSMSDGGRLAGARRALLSLVDRLDPADHFGLVTFDDTAQVAVPAAPLRDKDSARRAVSALRTGGGTDLSSGLLRGIQEARRASRDQGATLLLVSDGHANLGVTDHAALGRIARDARSHGISITTLGYGLGYDEDLLGAIADGGGGSALHAEDPDTAGQLIAAEVTGLLAKSAQAVSLTIRPREPVTAVTVYGRLPSTSIDDGIVVELADFYAGETRKLLLRLAVPGIAALGLATIAELVFTYVETATLTTYTITVPIHVNVVPGDQAAGRIPDVAVRAERLFQEVQEAKRTSIDALAAGDADQAAQLLDAARASLEEGAAWATDRAEEFAAEAEDLRRYSAMSHIDIGRTRKEAYQSWSHHTRTSGRPNYPDTPTKGENEA